MNRSNFLALIGAAIIAPAAVKPKEEPLRWRVQRQFGSAVVDVRYMRRPHVLLVSPEDYAAAVKLLNSPLTIT